MKLSVAIPCSGVLVTLAVLIGAIQSVPVFSNSTSVLAVPQDDANELDARIVHYGSYQARLGTTISEIEWLLNQLVTLLSEMVDGIEHEPELLHNYAFRQILIRVIKRIDYILEHFENAGPHVLTRTVQIELQRIDCVRIRLANYIAQRRKLDDSKCSRYERPEHERPENERRRPGYERPEGERRPENERRPGYERPEGERRPESERRPVYERPERRPSNNHRRPGASNHHDVQIMPILTQIVSLLGQILTRLNAIEADKADPSYSTTTASSVNGTTETSDAQAASAINAINWDDLINEFVQSIPAVSRPTTTEASVSANGSGDSGAINWDMIFTTQSSVANTANWNDMINKIMSTYSSTTTAASAGDVSSSDATTNWEDAMNGLIGDWTNNRLVQASG